MIQWKWLALAAAWLLIGTAWTVAKDRIDLAEFGRVVELPDVPKRVTTSEDELRRGTDGWEAVREADGQYTIGIEWDEPRDISEVNIEFRHAIANREQIRVEYWKAVGNASAKPGETTPADATRGEWLTPKTEWWAGDRDVSFAFSEEDLNVPAAKQPGKVFRRTTRIRFLCGKDDLPPVRYLRAYGPDKVVSATFELRFDRDSRFVPPLMVTIVNGFALSTDDDTLDSAVIREAPGSLRLRYFATDTTSLNRTRVTLSPVDKPKQQVTFMPAEVTLKHGPQGAQLRIPESGILVDCKTPPPATSTNVADTQPAVGK